MNDPHRKARVIRGDYFPQFQREFGENSPAKHRALGRAAGEALPEGPGGGVPILPDRRRASQAALTAGLEPGLVRRFWGAKYLAKVWFSCIALHSLSNACTNDGENRKTADEKRLTPS